MSTSRDLQLAYLAGVVDSDGWVLANLREGSNSFNFAVGITQAEPGAVALAHSMFGGGLKVRSPRPDKRGIMPCRDLFEWRIGPTTGMASVLTELLPFLLIKREKVKIVLALMQERNSRGRSNVTQEQVRRRAALYLAYKAA